MFSRLAKVASNIFFFGSGILAFINLFFVPFSDIVFYGYTWGQIISGVFIVSVFWVVIQLNVDIKNLQNKMPSVKVDWLIRNGYAVLEVFNSGGFATFHANFRTRIKTENNFQPSQPFRMYWQGRGDEAKLDKGDTGVINVAGQRYFTDSITRLYLVNAGTTLEITDWPNTIYLEITITSEPTLKKPFSNMVFSLSQSPSTKEIVFVPEKKSRKFW